MSHLGVRNRVARKNSGRRTVHHGVGVFHADAIGAEMTLHQVHDGIVCVAIRPVALPFEQCGESSHRLCPSLDDTPHRIVVSQLADASATVLRDINVVAVVKRLDCG